MSEPVRLGILGASAMIARRSVLPAIAASDRVALVASASQSGDHPAGVTHRFASYDDLLACDEVEAVYVPLPNGLHERWVTAAAAAGKHVLCEKPLALTAAAAQRMAAACARAGVVFMEAYMTPFHPRTRRLWQLVTDGTLGTLHHVHTHFSWRMAGGDDHRIDAELGGGSLLDLGVYCLEPILLAGGWDADQPLPDISAHADWHVPGVDLTTTGYLTFPSGVTGSFMTSFDAPHEQRIDVVGSQGAARITTMAYTGDVHDIAIAVVDDDGTTTLESAQGAEYQLMVEHFCDVVRGAADLERPPARSVGLARVIDHIREIAA